MAGLTIEEKQRRRKLRQQGLKECSSCGRVMPLSEFYDRSDNGRKRSRCKHCVLDSQNSGERRRESGMFECLYRLGYKWCPNCKTIKALSEFHKSSSRRYGIDCWCKVCNNNRPHGIILTKRKERKELAKEGLKRCTKCKKIFPFSEFYSGASGTADGYTTRCRWCQGYTGKKEREDAEKEQLARMGLKRCGKCGRVKQIHLFYKNRSTKDGLSSYCKKCLKPAHKAHKARRQARKAGLPMGFKASDWEKAKEFFNNQCAYCDTHGELTQEHYIPICRGGGSIPSNIIPACADCNFRKNDMHPDDWIEQENISVERTERIQEYFKLVRRQNNGKP